MNLQAAIFAFIYTCYFVQTGKFGCKRKPCVARSMPAYANLSTVASCIRCYQCSSDENKSKDDCGAYEPFDTTKNSPVDCMGEDAVTPGTFCYKSIQQGPRGFIWDGRWRTVTRRCAQISERGISWGCDWGFHENGVYWEECYCAEDGCNAATATTMSTTAMTKAIVAITVLAGIALNRWNTFPNF